MFNIKLILRDKSIFIFLLLLFVFIILKNAWVSDDAYITFRTLDNFLHGYGLRWNINERVQAFTNPLWLFLMVPFNFFHPSYYYSSIFLSILLAITSFTILYKYHSFNHKSFILSAIILIFSNSVIDYTTSGLENVLGHLLLIIFLALFFSGNKNRQNFFLFNFVTCLIIFNRMDGIVLIFPLYSLYLFRFFKKSERKDFKALFLLLVLSFTPLILWEIFSIIYYGFPFPNTAYAKLNTGLERSVILNQGLNYIADLLKNDIAGSIAILLALIVSFPYKKNADKTTVFVSILLNILYIVWIGGDFMSGRFFSTTIILSATVLSRLNINWKTSISLSVVIVFGTLTFARNPVLILVKQSKNKIVNNITDEKAYYYNKTGLFNSVPFSEKPLAPYIEEGHFYNNVIVKFGTGISGYKLGPERYIIDKYALSNSLLARIPYERPWEITRRFRSGHLKRDIPLNYVESERQKKNILLNPHLKEFYEKILVITRDELFSYRRFSEIIKMNLGFYDKLIAEYAKQKTFRAIDMKSDYKNSKTFYDKLSDANMVRIRKTEQPPNKFLIYGPYINLRKGKYRIDFRIKGIKLEGNSKVANLDVVSRGTSYASKIITSSDLKNNSSYTTFSLYFELHHNTNKMEFRVKTLDNSEFCVDTIKFVKLH